MDNLEHYLDQVCRSVGGSKALRQHIRQDLREHLRDAGGRASGGRISSEDDARLVLLADFGGPEQVRSELDSDVWASGFLWR